MNIVIAGGSGLIGTALIKRLTAAGHTVTVLTRNPTRTSANLGAGITAVKWDGVLPGAWDSAVESADAVINLAGSSIGEYRWNMEQKELMTNSRLQATRVLIETIVGAKTKPSVLINASAVGYYGDVKEGEVDETAPWGKDFLAELCKKWEEEAYRAELVGVRTVMVRTGLVLTSSGGALGKLLPPFKMFVGGPLGSGNQWWPWVHIDDEIGMIMYALEHDTVRGAFNAAAPTPVRMKDFAKVLGGVLGRPSVMPTPAFALRLLLGEMADALLLSGQRAMPKKMLEAGYQFKYVDLEKALTNLLK